MSSNETPYLQMLPVELLHQIFDSLDAETIAISLRQVCRVFRIVVNNYDRYSLDFKSISKPSFYLLCQLIHPERVISLTLCNDERTPDQTDLFLSLFRVGQLNRLRSLTLSEIDESQLEVILKRISINLLSSLSLHIQDDGNRQRKTTVNPLLSVIAQSNIRKLDLYLSHHRIQHMQWPISCTVRHLEINECMSFNDLCNILRCSPHLKTVIIRHYLYHITSDTILSSPPTTSFRQLTSLTIEQPDVSVGKLENFLSRTPSLVYLKLMGNDSILDGYRWEQFIEANLPLLNKFEFFFDTWRRFNNQNLVNIEWIVAPFRSPFWIEYKKWFIICEYRVDNVRPILLYSVPVCQSSMEYEPDSQKMWLSTYPKPMYSDPSMMESVDTISLSMTKAVAVDIEHRVSRSVYNYKESSSSSCSICSVATDYVRSLRLRYRRFKRRGLPCKIF